MAVLSDDMLTVKEEAKHIIPYRVKGTSFEAHPFFEGSSMRKVGKSIILSILPGRIMSSVMQRVISLIGTLFSAERSYPMVISVIAAEMHSIS